MKTQERHHLKQNEFVVFATQAANWITANRNLVLTIAAAIVVVGSAAGGYFYMQKQTNDQASALLGAALRIQDAPVVPAPTVPGAVQQAGTFATELARDEAAVAAFQTVVDRYGDHQAGLEARYHLAGVLLSLGRKAEAEEAYAAVIAKAGSSLPAVMAQLGRAQVLASEQKFDEAIKILTDLSGQRDSALPMDGVLMELARISAAAGKTQEARAAYKRIVDEFSQSPYAGEARQRLAAMG